MNLDTNKCYFGTFDTLETKDGDPTKKRRVYYCSELVRQIATTNTKYVRVYIPNDWMNPIFNNILFLKQWCSIISKWFNEVEYEGKKDNPAKIQNFQGSGGPHKIKIYQGGDIEGKWWHVFLIHVNVKEAGINLRTYATYCLLRYMCVPHYWGIIENFITFYNEYFNTYEKAADSFNILQLSHFIYNPVYPFVNSKGLFSIRAQECFPKYLNLEEVKQNMISRTSLNSCFNWKKSSNIKVKEFLWEVGGNIKQIIELNGKLE